MAMAKARSKAARKSPARKPVKAGARAAVKLPPGKPVLLIGTRKGAFILRGDETRRAWKLDGPHFLGNEIYHLLLDPRDGRTLLMAAAAGHLGPTVFRSTDRGKTWTEAKQPPAFPKVKEGEEGPSVRRVFWLTPGHASEPGVWYAGTTPAGLFRTQDGGVTWEGVTGFNEHPSYGQWFQGPGSPIGPLTHSVRIDPRDPAHLYLGVSSGGTFESTDKGRSWAPLNKGVAADFIPTPDPEFGHDPHTVVVHPAHPDRLYQQNHCGIYRLDRPGTTWERIGKNMPKKIGDIGFNMVVHPRDPETAWVFPFDGSDVWPRTSPEGKPAVYRTQNGGKSWTRQDKGFPRGEAWWTVMRQAMAADLASPVGLYLGTTQGEIWGSRDEGASWQLIARNLPEVYSVSTGYLR